MFTKAQPTQYIVGVAIASAVAVMGFVALSTSVNAATYAYVDAAGDVKSVTANDWMAAISTAPNIHMHSGVMLLTAAGDYNIVGDSVVGY